MNDAACSCRVITGRILLRVLEREHQAGGVLAGAAEGGLDPDALQSLDDRLVDPHASPSLSVGHWSVLPESLLEHLPDAVDDSLG